MAAFATAAFCACLAWGIGGELFVLYVTTSARCSQPSPPPCSACGSGSRQAGRLGESIWAVYDHVLREVVPVPSWADVGYLSSLLFLSWTFVLGPLWQSTDLTTAGGLVALGYPFGDALVRQALLVIDLIAPREGRRGSLGERLQSALVGAVPEAAVESSPSRSPEQVKP